MGSNIAGTKFFKLTYLVAAFEASHFKDWLTNCQYDVTGEDIVLWGSSIKSSMHLHCYNVYSPHSLIFGAPRS